MKKQILILIGILFFSFVSGASSISTSGEMSFDQQASGIVSEIVCMEQPLVCSENKIIGQIKGEIMNSIAAKDPKLAEAIGIFGQVQSLGAEVLKDVRFDDEGEIETGSLQFGNTSGGVGKIVNKNLKEGDIVVSNVKLDKSKTDSTFSFNKEGGSLEIKGDKFENIKACENEGDKCFVNLDEEGEISKADFETNEKGGVYVFEGTEINVPANSRVTYDKNTGIKIDVADDGELNELPKLKEGFEGEGSVVKISGKNVKLPGGHVLQEGELSYNGKNFYVKNGNEATIEGVEIKNVHENTNIFFDGKRHEGNYISMDFENKKLVAGVEKGSEGEYSEFEYNSFVAEFKEDNPFIKIEKGDFVNFNLKKDSEIEIQNRDELGLIPKVIAKGDLIISEDGKSINRYQGKIFLDEVAFYGEKVDEFERTTSPIELIFDGEEDKIFVDNFNRFALGVPQEAEEFTSKNGWIDIKFSARVKYNYFNEEDLKKIFEKEISFKGVEDGGKQMLRGRLRDYYSNTYSGLKNDLEKIKFYTEEEYAKVMDGSAFAERKDRSLNFKMNSFTSEEFYHEIAHLKQFKIEEERLNEIFQALEKNKEYEGWLSEETSLRLKNNERYLNLRKRNDQFNELIPNLIAQRNKARVEEDNKEVSRLSNIITSSIYEYNDINSEIFDIKENIRKSTKEEFPSKIDLDEIFNKDNFISKWKDTSGNVFKKDTGKEYGLQNGCVSNYGCEHYSEDISEFVRAIYVEPDFFTNLIDSKSPKYDIRYRQKLDLLYTHDFISDTQYNKILEVAGVK